MVAQIEVQKAECECRKGSKGATSCEVCAAGKLLQANEQGCRTHQSKMAQASMQESRIHWKLYMIWILNVDYGLKAEGRRKPRGIWSRSRATSDMNRVLDSLQPAKPCRLEEHVGNVCRTGDTGTAATEGAQGGVHHILYSSTVGVYAE